MRRQFLVGVAGLVVFCGCAGVSPAQVGQTAGTIAGAAVAPGVGAPLGALVGLLTGMVIQGQVDKVTEQHERKELGEQLASALPRQDEEAVPPPSGEPARVWVDETLQGGRIVDGHFEARSLP